MPRDKSTTGEFLPAELIPVYQCKRLKESLINKVKYVSQEDDNAFI